MRNKLDTGLGYRRLACLLLAAGGLTLGAATHAEPAAVTISDAWVRALPPTQRNTAAYLQVHNPGAAPVRITGGSTALAEAVEIHESVSEDGIMRMRQLQALSLAPGETRELAPGGVHLMLLGLERMPAPGDTLSLCLTVEGADPVCSDAPVRRDMGDAGHAHHH